MAVSIALAVFFTLITTALYLMMRREVRNASADVKARLDQLFRQGHGTEPCPTGAAVVTEATPTPEPTSTGEPAPALVRSIPPASESREAIRARHEAEADARSLARVATVEDAAGVRRAILPPAPPNVAQGPQRRGTPTLMSAGVEPSTLRTGSTPPLPALPDVVDQRYQELCDAARGAGLPADHCCGGDCYGTPESVLCECTCDGCVRATSYAEQAEREIMGPSEEDTDPRRRGA